MQRFLSFLQSKTVLDGNFLTMITEAVQKMDLYKTTYLSTEGQPLNSVHFLLDGFVYSSEKFQGREILTDFWEPMSFIIPHGISKQTYYESLSNVQLLENSSLIRIEGEDIDRALDHPQGRQLYHHLVSEEFRRRHRHTRFLQLCTVKERVKYLTENHPAIFRHLSHEQISSFVGTSRPNLTNVLADLTRSR